MPDWSYGDAYKRFPIEVGTAVFENGSRLKTHDIFNPLPDFMQKADLLFVDPPWNKGNLTSFYTKADMDPPEGSYERFYARLFDCIGQIKPAKCYIEIGKQYLADFIVELRKQYAYVTFYNSSYYHRKENMCYIVRGSNKAAKPALDYIDEEDAISRICAEEDYNTVADLCMGRGLVANAAYLSGKTFVGTELNHKRLSVALERLAANGAKYTIE